MNLTLTPKNNSIYAIIISVLCVAIIVLAVYAYSNGNSTNRVDTNKIVVYNEGGIPIARHEGEIKIDELKDGTAHIIVDGETYVYYNCSFKYKALT